MPDGKNKQDPGEPQGVVLNRSNPEDQELAKIFTSPNPPQAEDVPETLSFVGTQLAPAIQDDGPAKIWTNVPDGSVLELRVASQNPTAAAIGRFSNLAGKVELWPHQAISPGPKTRLLASADRKYVLSIIVAFDGDHPGKVGILAHVIHQGAIINTYFHVVRGARGDVELSKVLIDMK